MLCNKKIRSFDNNSRFRTNPGSWEVVEILYPGNVSSWLFFFVCFSQRKLLLNGVFSFQIQGFFVKNSVNFFSLMFEFVELFEFSDVSNHFRSHDLDGKTKVTNLIQCLPKVPHRISQDVPFLTVCLPEVL